LQSVYLTRGRIYLTRGRIYRELKKERVNDPMKKWVKEKNTAFSKEKSTNGKKKNKKRWSTSLAIKEMQIKTTLKFHLTSIAMAINKKTNNKY
jgi:hypothetical protein